MKVSYELEINPMLHADLKLDPHNKILNLSAEEADLEGNFPGAPDPNKNNVLVLLTGHE